MKRATVIAALARLARVATVRAEARRRLERYLDDRSTLDPNLVPVVAGLAARDGDGALYERYLARKRASAADDPEEEERFLFALTSFEAPARCLSEARVGASTPKAKFSTVSISAGVGKPRSMALS